MNAIKIDVLKKEIYEIEISEGLRPIYKAIGNGCSLFCCPLMLPNLDTFYLDDEALCHGPAYIIGGFSVIGYTFVNNAIILGTDEEGGSVDVKSTIEEIRKIISFHSVIELFQLY